MILSPKLHRWIYLVSLTCIAIGLPFSKALISIGEIVLVLNFLSEGHWRQRWDKFKQLKTSWWFIGFFLLHAVGLLWTSDFEYALSDIRVKAPLLIFPLVVPLSHRLRRSEFLWIAAFFAGAVIIASFFSTYTFFQSRDEPGFNYRDISLFTSHIRYSLMVCLSYIFLLNCAWNEEKNKWLKMGYVLLAVWLSLFVFILQSMTGIVIWFLCSYMLLFYTMFYLKQPFWRITGTTILWVMPLLMGTYLALQVDAFYPDSEPNYSMLEAQSAAGEYYHHDTLSGALENAHYIDLYIAPRELESGWKTLSDIPYPQGLDAKGHYIYTTLIRYMTSKGLRKDSVGLSKLSDKDIEAVESGVANVRFLYGNALDNRIYTVIWEIDKMIREKRVQGHSVTQRFVYWRTGWQIFKEQWLIGVGTGDVDWAYKDMYDRLDSRLTEKYRKRSHNQYLNILVTFGILGFLIFIVSAVLPFLRIKHTNSFLYIGFCIILYASMLNEDTLDTQIGVTLYALFNALLLYATSGLRLSRSNKTSS